MVLVATRDIGINEELFFEYGSEKIAIQGFGQHLGIKLLYIGLVLGLDS